MDKDIVYIDMKLYDSMYSQWVLAVFGKAMDDFHLMKRFDKSIGLESYDEVENEADAIDTKYFSFVVIDKRKLMVAKLKYGF